VKYSRVVFCVPRHEGAAVREQPAKLGSEHQGAQRLCGMAEAEIGYQGEDKKKKETTPDTAA
jgi:hypothetical protein